MSGLKFTDAECREWCASLQRRGRVYLVERKDGTRAWLGPGGFACRAVHVFAGPDEDYSVWPAFYGANDERGNRSAALASGLTEDEAIARVARGAWR